MSESGFFISIEGTEGVGKSTAIEGLKGYFLEKNIDAVFTREPGGTPNAEKIRALLLGSALTDPQSETELMLMYASRLEHTKSLILPALENGKVVVSDRFFDASFAYQGGGRGLDCDIISKLNNWVLGEFKPNLTILLDAPHDVCAERMARRKEKDRIEQEQADFFERVRMRYLSLAEEDPRFEVIDASMSAEAVLHAIVSCVEKHMPQFIRKD